MARRHLPPLDTLIVFEKAARNVSFTRAAEELLVSQAAVSKRIRQLEDWLGQELFNRDRKALELTDAGRKLQETAQLSLDYLERGLASVTVQDDATVRIASNMAVSLFWLMPRLKEFSLREDSIQLQTLTSERRADLLQEDVDIAIVYGRAETEIPGWRTQLLFDEVLVPVASKAVAQQARKALNEGETHALCLLNYRRVGPDWVNWENWIAETGAREFAAIPRRQCATYAQSIGDAIAGRGIALGSLSLVKAEIARGRLERLGGFKFRRPYGYFLISRQNPSPGTSPERLRDFLLRS